VRVVRGREVFLELAGEGATDEVLRSLRGLVKVILRKAEMLGEICLPESVGAD
jgi:hypothetical protein